MPKVSRGDIVRINFRDHVIYGNRTLACVIYGRVASVSDRDIVVEGWHFRRRRPGCGYDPDNETRYTILRSTITKIERLVPQDEEV